MRTNRILLITALMLWMSPSARAGVTSIKLLAPDVGWATTEDYDLKTLFWTADGGAHWKNITPNPFTNSDAQKIERSRLPYGVQQSSIRDVFFLDTHRGWVLFCCNYPPSIKGQDDELPQYDLAVTADSGTSWSIAHVPVPADTNISPNMDDYGGQVAFADPQHGWLNLTANAGHTTTGTLLVTSDGGRTWRAAHDGPPGGADPFLLVTPTLGWQVSSPNPWAGDDESGGLYVTRDGAKSWQQVSVPFPNEMLSAGAPIESRPTDFYNALPTFEDSEHGFLPVTYLAQQADGNSAIVLFETLDGGQSWKPIRAITNLDIPGVEASYTVAVADSTLISATSSKDDKRVTLSRGGPDGRADTDITGYIGGWRGITYLQLSFASPKQGWMVGNGALLSTTDGGVTWATLTPHIDLQKTVAARSTSSVANSIHLLSSDIGWAVMQGSFYWTESGGADWSITSSSGLPQGRISSAFFLDTKRGWALSCGANGWAVFSTTNAGAEWSITNVNISGVTGDRADCQIYFADSMHGWISLDSKSGSNPLFTKTLATSVLATSDGGRTWGLASNDIGAMGNIRFVTPTDGWMVVPPNDELYVTRDGAKDWTKVSLPPPKEVYPATEATYDLPTFEDSKHGFLPVTYSGALGVKAAAVLVATEDGGQTWKPDRMLTDLNGLPVGNRVASTVVGPAWIVANVSDDAFPTLTQIASGATVHASSNAGPSYYGAAQLSFVSPMRGWVVLNDGRVLSTTDEGATWSDLIFAPRAQLFGRLSAPHPLSVVSMQLLGPEVGVATLGNGIAGAARELHLMRTENGGAQWKEISPPLTAADKMVAPFFFVDATHGWMVLWHWEPVRQPGKPEFEPIFETVYTADAGANWSRAQIDLPELASRRDTILPSAQISFVDSLHGWMDLTISPESNPNSRWERTLITADGGKSWSQVPNSPIKPVAVRFVTPMEGWMIGNPSTPAAAKSPAPALDAKTRFLPGRMEFPNPHADRERFFRRHFGVPTSPPLQMAPGNSHGGQAGEELYVTRDGAKSWQKVSLEIPTDFSEDIASHPPRSPQCVTTRNSHGQIVTDVTYPPPTAIYNLPTFSDGERGFLPVTYTAVSGIEWEGSKGVPCGEVETDRL